MNLSEATSERLIFLNQPLATKEAIFSFVAQKFAEEGIVASADAFKTALYDRENQGITGFENGLAIPHGKSTAVKKAAFAVVRLAQPLSAAEYPSLSADNRVDTLFALAIPEAEAGTTHLDILAELATRLGDAAFLAKVKAAQTPAALFKLLAESDKAAAPVLSGNGKGLILGITACAAGIAHTYMAADAIAKKAAELGYHAKVEKQGANGIEDRLTTADVNQAIGVIYAHDVALKELERFAKLPKLDVPVSDPIKDADKVINALLEKAKNYTLGGTEAAADVEEAPAQKQSFLKALSSSVMTGISYMIPLLVGAGLMMGIATLIWAYILHLPMTAVGSATYLPGGAANATGLTLYTNYLYLFGSLLLKFIYPIFGMFAAYAIADRTGLIAGFAGGLFASGLQFTLWAPAVPSTTADATKAGFAQLAIFNKGAIPSGFLGALLLGLAAGFLVKWLNEHIKVHKNLQAIKPMFLIPGISVLVIFILNFLIVQPIFGGLNQAIADWITSMSGSGKLILSSIIAACTAFDLGGPVNKAAGAINIALAAAKTFPLTARVLSIVIPPIGLGLSTIIDRFIVRRRVYPEDLRVAGGTAFLLGFIAISEGGIPFMLRNPLIVIPVNIVGAIAGSVTAVSLGAVQWLPLPAVWGWPLVTGILPYLIGLAVGVLVIALANIFIRYAVIKRKEARGEAIGF